jgi:protein TonB
VTTTTHDRSDLPIWIASAIVVLGLHAGGAAALFTWHDPIAFGVPSDAIVIDLTPYSPPSETVEDIAPGPQQQEEAPPPPPKQEKVEQKIDEKVDVPPAPVPPVAALPPPEPPKPKDEPTPMPVAPAPATTAPPRAHASKAEVDSWYGHIVTQLERNKSYPLAAREHGEKGVVELAFSIDREGHVLSSRIVKSSGYAALDQETIATVRRAQPFPVPPTGVDGEKFDFTVPVKFNIR